jgi:hypothetical protein
MLASAAGESGKGLAGVRRSGQIDSRARAVPCSRRSRAHRTSAGRINRRRFGCQFFVSGTEGARADAGIVSRNELVRPRRAVFRDDDPTAGDGILSEISHR